jgi:hypothetical protein
LLSIHKCSLAPSHLQHLPHLAELSLASVDQQAWRALGQLAQLQKLCALYVAPDASVQLPALEHLMCGSRQLPPGAPPGSLSSALPALKVLEVRASRRFIPLQPTAIQALQGHTLLAKISINFSVYDATPAGA